MHNILSATMPVLTPTRTGNQESDLPRDNKIMLLLGYTAAARIGDRQAAGGFFSLPSDDSPMAYPHETVIRNVSAKRTSIFDLPPPPRWGLNE